MPIEVEVMVKLNCDTPNCFKRRIGYGDTADSAIEPFRLYGWMVSFPAGTAICPQCAKETKKHA